MYNTMEPDVMSFGAILWARLDALYYGLNEVTETPVCAVLRAVLLAVHGVYVLCMECMCCATSVWSTWQCAPLSIC